MNRIIKFRAWLIKEKIMVDVADWIDNGRVRVYIHDSGPFLKQPKEIELMQYTGLKDVYGKELLYEDDIIEVVEPTISKGDITIKGHIIYSNDYAAWMIDFPQHGECRALYHFTDTGFEVIGNIHANPNLLDEK